MSDGVPIPKAVHSQIEAIRINGTHNMVTEMDSAVRDYDFPELTEWYDEHRDDYVRATLGGEGWDVREEAEAE